MALEFSNTTLMTTDKKYFFLESPEKESDGYSELKDMFHEYFLVDFNTN